MLNIDSSITDKILHDKSFRIALSKKSHYYFFHIYFSHYVQFPSAEFHKELFAITEDENIKNAVIIAFRGSGKSTIFALSYVLWSILGGHQKKFVILLSQTQQQARQLLTNIKEELERNELLKKDFGPFGEETDEWNAQSLVLSFYNSRISAFSSGESIRGIRHREYRPDLIIADDVEDLSSAKTKEGRDKTYIWFNGEAIPAGDHNTKVIAIGNLLHEDSLMMRLRKEIEENKRDGIVRTYPLLTEDGACLWSEKFPTQDSIEKLKKSIGSNIAWQREFLLHIVPDEDQLIQREWIQYYDVLPPIQKLRYAFIGVDLAISQSSSADYTAMVPAYVFGSGEECQIYILPHIVNKRLNFLETLVQGKLLFNTVKNSAQFIIEDIAYQKAAIQQFQQEGLPAEGIKLQGQDKHMRLSLTTHLIQQGKILFPKDYAEELINQLVGFSVEKHDDLADAFAYAILKIQEEISRPEPNIRWL